METSAAVRRQALIGGFVLLGGALLLLALAGVFVADRATPEEIWGVYTPLAFAVLALEFAAFAFVPAIWGDDPGPATRRALRVALVSLGILGVAAAAGAATLAEGHWAWGALLPGLMSLVPVRDGLVLHRRLAAMAARHEGATAPR